ncbi:Plasmodium vivax Vir protein, putative [Plasmodium vivax]|nr:Plasmodium vivax Vir protein, putative [Plasmodium vivax]
MPTHLKKKDLEELTSQINYSYFERGDAGCEGFHFYSTIKGELEGTYQNYDFLNISDKIVRGLCYIYNKKGNRRDDFDKELCSYLYYWIGAKIYPIIKTKTLFLKIISMIYDEFYINDIYNTCNPLYKDIDNATFNTYKLLFDYSKDHKNINLDTVYGNARCDEEYINFVQNYIKAYMDVHSCCTANTGNKYDCGYFNELFEKYNHTDLKSFHCMKPNVKAILADEKEVLERSRPSTSLSQTSRRTPVPLINPYPQGNNGQNLNRNLHEDLGLSGREVQDSGASIRTDETAENGSTKTIMGSVAPVLGVSSISLLLYKVTPVGGFINKLLGRNINMYNAVEGMDEFNPYSDGMDLGSRRMNISYHRL